MIRGFTAAALLGLSLFMVGCGTSVPEETEIKSKDPDIVQKQIEQSKKYADMSKQGQGGDTEVSGDAVKGAAGVGMKK